MDSSERRIRSIARQQLDQRLQRIREAGSLLDQPRGGWVNLLRNALGMTQAQLAKRVGVSRQAIGQLEQREAEGTATLGALEQAAEALGGRLVYAIVPERSISETLEQRALDVAARITGSVRHSMKLEDQEPSTDLDQRTRDLAEELLASPSQLWSDPGGR
jgi:predicted DNA-binding mobile mystery protein A